MSKYTEDKLRKAVKDSTSISETMRKLGIVHISGGSHSHISKQIKKFNIDITHFLGQGHNKGKSAYNKKTIDEIFIDRSDIGESRQKVKQLRRALLESGVEHKCAICGLNSWNGDNIVLQIDHINGNYLNDLKDNLRFLCPNCHSQLKTNTPHKNTQKVLNKCIDCGKDGIYKTAIRCKKCNALKIGHGRRKMEITKDELKSLLNKHSLDKIGEMFGVSGSAVWKRAKKYNLK